MNDAGHSQEQDANRSADPGIGRLSELQKRVLVASAYYAAVISALLLSHWLIFKVGASSIIILIALVAPFIASRLSSLEYGGVKVELNEFKHEVRGATRKLSREVSETRDELSSKFEQLVNQSREYLRPQSLEFSDAKAGEIRKEVDISAEEVNLFLASPNPDLRIIAYIQLQARPEPDRLQDLADCFFLEGFLASKQKETRPLWQLLVAVQSLSEDITKLDDAAKSKTAMAMHHFLEWLEADTSVDRGGQCKTRLRLLIPHFQ
jgi:hypothetical protein